VLPTLECAWCRRNTWNEFGILDSILGGELTRSPWWKMSFRTDSAPVLSLPSFLSSTLLIDSNVVVHSCCGGNVVKPLCTNGSTFPSLVSLPTLSEDTLLAGLGLGRNAQGGIWKSIATLSNDVLHMAVAAMSTRWPARACETLVSVSSGQVRLGQLDVLVPVAHGVDSFGEIVMDSVSAMVLFDLGLLPNNSTSVAIESAMKLSQVNGSKRVPVYPDNCSKFLNCDVPVWVPVEMIKVLNGDDGNEVPTSTVVPGRHGGSMSNAIVDESPLDGEAVSFEGGSER